MKPNYIILILLFLFFSGCSESGVLKGTMDVNITNPIYTNESIIPTLTHQQHSTHEGKTFTTRMSGIILSGTTRYGVFKSDGKRVHFFARRINVIDVGGKDLDFEFKVYEGAAITTNGTSLNVFNLDRDSNNTNTLLGFADPSGINLTNAVWLEPFGNRIKAEKKSSVVHAEALEYIMKENEYYLIEFSNYGMTSIEVQYDVIWGEVEK